MFREVVESEHIFNVQFRVSNSLDSRIYFENKMWKVKRQKFLI